MIDLPEMPSDARPYEIAIMTFYYTLKIKDPEQIATALNYKDRSNVTRVLKKYRVKVMTH
jgi:hypothetical protein